MPGQVEMTRVINSSWTPLRSYLGSSQAQQLILSGQSGALLGAMPWGDWLYNLEPVQMLTVNNVRSAIKSEMKNLPGIEARSSFNVIDQISQRYGTEYSGRLIKNLSDTSRSTVRQLIGEAMSGQRTVDSTARALRSSIGLHPAWASAVAKTGDRAYVNAIKNGLTDEKARAFQGKAMEQHAKKLTRRRAENIARTEIQTASNVGTWATWEHAVANGYAERNSRKEWNPGPGACGICAPLSGEIVAWDEPFSNGDMMPPGHPSCRCSASLLPPDFTPDKIDWTNADQRTAPKVPKKPTRKPKVQAPKGGPDEDMFTSQLDPGANVYSLDPKTGAPSPVEILRPKDLPGDAGDPFSVENSYHVLGANRHTGALEYENNCTSCATAYELRRRGFNVTAGHNNGRGRNNKEWMSGWWNNKDGSPRSTTMQPKALIEDWWDEMPEGARGVMSVAWKSGGAHALNWEKMADGTIWILDGQIGRRARFDDYKKRIVDPINLMRTDDAIPNRNIANAVERNPMMRDRWDEKPPEAPKMNDEQLADVLDFLEG